MIVNTKPTYKCEHCRKLYQIQSACERHEIRCSKNPDNFKACYDCQFLEKIEVEVNTQDYNGNDNFSQRSIMHCSKLQKYLIPLKLEYSDSTYLQEDIEDGEKENVKMPKECEHQEAFPDFFK